MFIVILIIYHWITEIVPHAISSTDPEALLKLEDPAILESVQQDPIKPLQTDSYIKMAIGESLQIEFSFYKRNILYIYIYIYIHIISFAPLYL